MKIAVRLMVLLTLFLLFAFVTNSFVDARQLDELKRKHAGDRTLRQISVASSPVPLQVRCDVVGKRTGGTYFHIPGAGCSWIYNAVPLWELPKLVQGVEVCTFSRQGLPFTVGAPNNATAASVEQLVRQVVELIDAVTDRQQPLWLSGHSYGGLQATLVAKRLLENGRTPKAVVLIDAAPLFVAEEQELQNKWEAVVRQLSSMSSVIELLSAIGVSRLFATQMLALAAPTALDYIPEQYRDSYLYAVASPANYVGLKADFDRYFPTATALKSILNDRAQQQRPPLLGDVPLELLQASAVRFTFVEQSVLDVLVAHDTKSIYSSLSSRSRTQIIDEADHQFVSTPAAVRNMLNAIVAIVNR